jgi:hypothetical protein
MGFRSKRTFQTVLRAAGETETMSYRKTGFGWMKETLDFSF